MMKVHTVAGLFRSVRFILILSLLAVFSGCATTPKTPRRIPIQEGTIIRGEKPSEPAPASPVAPAAQNTPPETEPEAPALPKIDATLPAADLFKRGVDAYDEGDLDLALAYFLAVLEKQPAVPEQTASAYNAGIIWYRKGEYEKAERLFSRVRKTAQDRKDLLDSSFRLLACYYELKRWNETLALVEEIRAEFPLLNPDDQIELPMREGVAYFYLNETDKAETILLDTYYRYRSGSRKGEVNNANAGAQCVYYLGMIERRRFDGVSMAVESAEAQMEAMEKKSQHLLKAQDLFLRTIEQEVPYWATAAGFQIANLYKDFYLQIRSAPLPSSLETEEERQMYRCLLLNRISVLLEKAMNLYDRTISMAERLRVKNKWVSETKSSLDEVKKMYLEDTKSCADILPPPASPDPKAGHPEGKTDSPH